ncbi:hypothetical protein [Pseudomonas putida]|uniref:hypothetical protein n=1 Tax=Pseudomonas putida TaxID=303 RepID=UPI00300F151A
MLKVIPDPPNNTHSLENTLIQATDHALCTATVEAGLPAMRPDQASEKYQGIEQ